MKKNVSGQVIGVQMVSASDGSAFTGTVSALVTKDGATQSAGGGAVTHEGNGFHTYAITQSETNADHVAVTFTGSGAIPVTVQTYTINAIAAAVWDEGTASHTTAGTYGGRVLRSTGSNVEVLVTGSSHVAADVHEFQTDVLTSDAIATGAITAAALAADAGTEIASAVWDTTIASHVSAGTTGLALRDTDLRGSRTVIRGTVGTATTPSVTQFTTSSITPAGAVSDQFKGRIIVFDNDTTTVTLRGQATDITANSAASNPLLTFTALTTAPANGDTFSIV